MQISSWITPAIAWAASLLAAFAAEAAPLTGVTLNGIYTVYGRGDAVSVVSDGSATGILELGKTGNTPASTLTGMAGGRSIVLSSLTEADWFSTTLAVDYLSQAAQRYAGMTLAGPLLDAYVAQFRDTGAWRIVSDPKISYINYTNNLLTIAMAGYYDASPLLSSMFGITVPNVQISEVVKYSVEGGGAEFLYSYSATQLDDLSTATSGQYTFTRTVAAFEVPEPASIALLGLGLAGLASGKRRRQG